MLWISEEYLVPYKYKLLALSWLFGWLGFMAYQPFLVIHRQIYFHTNLAWVHNLIAKSILFQAIQFSQTVLIQLIFLHRVKCQNSSILNYSV